MRLSIRITGHSSFMISLFNFFKYKFEYCGNSYFLAYCSFFIAHFDLVDIQFKYKTMIICVYICANEKT